MGQKYAAYNAQGAIIAFYDSVDSPVPASVTNFIELTDGQWQTCINEQGQWYVSNGALAEVAPPSAAEQLVAAQAEQVALLSAACSAAIYAGFSSSALGASYSYPFKDLDQTNLNGEVSLSLLPSSQVAGWTTTFWCADSTGVWAMRAHTAAQIQQVGMDAAAAKLANVNKNIAFAEQVMSATTVAAVQAITWS